MFQRNEGNIELSANVYPKGRGGMFLDASDTATTMLGSSLGDLEPHDFRIISVLRQLWRMPCAKYFFQPPLMISKPYAYRPLALAFKFRRSCLALAIVREKYSLANRSFGLERKPVRRKFFEEFTSSAYYGFSIANPVCMERFLGS